MEAELTESVFASDMNRLNSNIDRLREHGIEVSVDDFGSGYSSLNLLSKVSVDTIKLDKQFLDSTLSGTQEETALTIIKYLIRMLKQLGFKVLAEGVETREQMEMLKKGRATVDDVAIPIQYDLYRVGTVDGLGCAEKCWFIISLFY